MRKEPIKYILGGVCGLLLGLGGAYGYAQYSDQQTVSSNSACATQYSLTNQSLDCVRFDVKSDQLQSLDSQLNTAAAQYVSEGKATRVSVFVRTLRSRQVAAANENDTYAPASLLKMPLMIAYYKLAAIEPSLLTAQLTYTGTTTLNDSSQDIAPASTLTIGSQYTVEQLIEDMIENSDNNAASVLLAHIDPQIFNNTLIDLGLKIPADGADVDFVTAKTYGNIFSMLYNASYLNRDYSQKALDIMSKSAFKDIATALPTNVTVADKFGEREVDKNGVAQTRELHDCGIVYVPGISPYGLCIMTEGTNFTDLQAIVKDLSAITYNSLK